MSFVDRRKFRSQTSDLWTDAETVVRAVREEKETAERDSRERQQRERERQQRKSKKVSRKKISQGGARKGRKLPKHCVLCVVQMS